MKYRCPACGCYVRLLSDDERVDKRDIYECNRCEDTYFKLPIPVKEKEDEGK